MKIIQIIDELNKFLEKGYQTLELNLVDYTNEEKKYYNIESNFEILGNSNFDRNLEVNLFLTDKTKTINRYIVRYKDMFGEKNYIEVYAFSTDNQETLEKRTKEFCNKKNIPLSEIISIEKI